MFDRTLLGLSNLSTSFGASLTLSNRPLRDDRRNIRQRFRASRPPALSHPRECNLVVRVALDDKRALSRCAPGGIGRSDIRADHDVRVSGKAGIAQSRAALGQPHFASTEVSEYLEVPTAEGVTPIDAGTCNRSNWRRLMLSRDDEDQRCKHYEGNEVEY